MIRNIIFSLSLFLLLILIPQNIQAQAVITAGQLQVLEDPDGKMTIEQVIAKRHLFQTAQKKNPNYFISPSAYWFRISVTNHLPDDARLFLDIAYPTLDYVTLYVTGVNGVRDIQKSGDRIPSAERPFPDATDLILPFEITGNESIDLYIRVQGEAQTLLFPCEILDEAGLRKSLLTDRLLHGIMMGIFLAMLISNFFLYITLRERARLYYLCYLPFAFLACSVINGSGPRFLYPTNAWLGNEGVTLFHGLSVIFSLMFTRVFIASSNHPNLDRLLKTLIGLGILMVFSALFLPPRLSYLLGVTMLMVSPLVLLMMGLYALRRGQTELRFYVLAQFITWMGTLLFALMVIGILPYHNGLLESIPIGICGGALLHSMAVADRIRMLQKKNLLVEQKARQNLEIHKNELEQLVHERTVELDQARQQAELQATTDVLTGIYNRRGLLKAAENMIQQTLRYGWPLSVAIMDIDHFKTVNDQCGHQEGDHILQMISRTVSAGLRGTDLFGRIGGEEFLIIMYNTPIKAAVELAGRLRLTIENNISSGQPPRRITASFGVAQLSEQINNMDDLIKFADDALYRAKQNGRNRVEAHRPSE